MCTLTAPGDHWCRICRRPRLRHAYTRLRAAWSANWGLYTLTATVLCLSASSLPYLHFGVLTLLGLLVPWTLLLVPRFPWTAVTVIALSAAWTISTGTFTATVVTAWLALFLLLMTTTILRSSSSRQPPPAGTYWPGTQDGTWECS